MDNLLAQLGPHWVLILLALFSVGAVVLIILWHARPKSRATVEKLRAAAERMLPIIRERAALTPYVYDDLVAEVAAALLSFIPRPTERDRQLALDVAAAAVLKATEPIG